MEFKFVSNTALHQFYEARMKLQPGDALLLYTDGVTEAMNPSQKIYGRERLSDYISKANTSIDELVKGIVVDVLPMRALQHRKSRRRARL